MTHSVFDPSFDDLPRVIPIFPLTGVLLLPTGKLPLNIFEPRYLAMIRDTLADEQRIIGMLQPRVPYLEDNRGAGGLGNDEPDLYKTGCAGRITSFTESDDGRYMLTLAGICRFDIAEEVNGKEGYRRILADYRRFRNDIGDEPEADIDRDRLLASVKEYFALQNIEASWDAILATPDDKLITSLAMTCPFGPNERQALLEAQTLSSRADIVITLLEMALLENGGVSDISH
jgi:Lon protease-like protein